MAIQQALPDDPRSKLSATKTTLVLYQDLAKPSPGFKTRNYRIIGSHDNPTLQAWSSHIQNWPPTYRASIANAAAAPMIPPIPATGASVRHAMLPLAVEETAAEEALSLATAEAMTLEAAASSDGWAELTLAQSRWALVRRSAGGGGVVVSMGAGDVCGAVVGD